MFSLLVPFYHYYPYYFTFNQWLFQGKGYVSNFSKQKNLGDKILSS
ncbi:hypothetical protein LEQ41_02900 [Streptococcus agalactiae]|nr:hypothetical protein [Streptococcus agalactiae]